MVFFASLYVNTKKGDYPYSEDLRSRIVHAVDQGKPRAEIVATFQISQATIRRYLKLRRETGELRAKRMPGRPPKKRHAVQVEVSAQLEAYPDATVEEHCRLWEAEHSVKVSASTMSRAIKQLNVTRKKTLKASEQNEEARAAWRASISTLKSHQFVFVDECGSNMGLTRLMARAPRGQRAYGKVPRNRGKNTTLIASLSLQGMGEALILEGAARTETFEL